MEAAADLHPEAQAGRPAVRCQLCWFRCCPTHLPTAPPLPHMHTQEFSVFTGRSMEEVRAAYGRGERAWCGLAHRLSDSPNCTVALSPHGSTYVAVAKPRAWLGGCPV